MDTYLDVLLDKFSFNCFLVIVVITKSFGSKTSEVKDYCQGEVFNARCSYDEVIVMKKAVYGRMRLERCVKYNMGHIGCQADVIDLAHHKCSGRRSCDISVPDVNFETMQPCLELQSYLEASFECHKVATVESSDCKNSRFLRTTHSSGSIASVTLYETWCGTKDSPWLVQGSKGQQINLTLIDYSVPSTSVAKEKIPAPHARATVSPQTPDPGCFKYALIEEKGENGQEDRSLVVCGRKAREQEIYLSRGHVVQVQLEARRQDPDYFLINYEVIGCTDPLLVGNSWFKRESITKGTVGCKPSAEKWDITCLQGVWAGDYSNCSDALYGESVGRSTSEDGHPSSNGKILIVVAVLVVLVTCFLIILTVFFYRRYHRNYRHHHHHHQCDYPTPASIKSKGSLYGTPDDDLDHHHHHHHHHQQSSYMTPSTRSLRYGHHHHHHHGHQQPHYEKNRRSDSPVSRGGYSDYSATNYEKMDEDGDAIAPFPLPQKTKTATVTLGSSTGEKFTHIWEMPLPVPGE